MLENPFFDLKPPKSLDRNAFAFANIGLPGYSVPDGAATLSALTVEADGTATFHARSPGKYAWLVQPRAYGDLAPGRPLNLDGVRVTAIGPASTFNVHTLDVQAPAQEREYDVVEGELKLREP